MEDELTCPVCLELYADPLLLPCSHSVCKKCLSDIIHKIDEAPRCPSCRHSLDVTLETVTTLPRNRALENVIFRYSEDRSRALSVPPEGSPSEKRRNLVKKKLRDSDFLTEQEILCDMCDQGGIVNKATRFCTQCEVVYCLPCLDRFHPKKGPLSKHRLTPPGEKKISSKYTYYCSTHQDELGNIYCESCSILVCRLCLCGESGSHVGHLFLSPDDAESKIEAMVKTSKQNLEQQLDNLTSQQARIKVLRDETSDTHDSAVGRIERQHKQLEQDVINVLTICKNSMIEKLAMLQTTTLSDLQTCYESVQTTEEEAEKLVILSDKLTKQPGRKITIGKEVTDLSLKSDSLGKNTRNLHDLLENAVLKQAEKVDLMCKASEELHSIAMKMLLKYSSEMTQTACLPVVPHIIAPTSPGQGDKTPTRVANKCLITWGFSSTTFTAERLTETSMWLVSVEKNTAHWANSRAGYLFGIGLSPTVLNTRDLVGMDTGNTCGIICNGGSVHYSQGGKTELLHPLGDVPLSVELRVILEENLPIVLLYKIRTPKFGLIMQGRKVLPWMSGECVHPVFTVSQRVKLLFPVSDQFTKV